MVFSRCTRKLIAGLGLAAMVFAQVAVAAHACTVLAPLEAPDASVSMHAGQDAGPCGDMNPGQDNLCFRHCQNSQPTLDHHPSPLVIAVAVPVYYVDQLDRPDVVTSALNRSRELLARVTAPPLSVRHCCFRT